MFCPIALAAIGRLPDTIHDRSVLISLRRRSPDDQITPLREREAKQDAAPLARRMAAWAKRYRELVDGSWPDMPDGLVDRPADVWEPLVALGDVAGGRWATLSRDAAVALDQEAPTPSHRQGVLLLNDIKAVFDDPTSTVVRDTAADGGRIRSVDLAARAGGPRRCSLG